MALRSLSLCAGVGALDLGLRIADPTIRTVCYVEWAKFPAAVLAARIADKTLDDAPVWNDVGTFDGRPWRGAVDLITAGFPCQPVSLAGKRLGMADERFIWGDIARIIDEVRPGRVLLENVPGIVTSDDGRFLDVVLGSLVSLGFDCEWDLFSAEETGAPHRRQRWFCLAYADRSGLQTRNQQSISRSTRGNDSHDCGGPLANTGRGSAGRIQHVSGTSGGTSDVGANREGRGVALGNPDGTGRREQCGAVATDSEQRSPERGGGSVGNSEETEQQWGRHSRIRRDGPANTSVYPPTRNDHDGWTAIDASAQPAFRRDAYGLAVGMDPSLVAHRNDRLRAVGNGVVPLTVALAWTELNERIRR